MPLNCCEFMDIFLRLLIYSLKICKKYDVSEAALLPSWGKTAHPNQCRLLCPRIGIRSFQWTQMTRLCGFTWWWKQGQLPKRRVFLVISKFRIKRQSKIPKNTQRFRFICQSVMSLTKPVISEISHLLLSNVQYQLRFLSLRLVCIPTSVQE